MPISPRATQGCRRIEAAYGSVLEGLLQRQLDFDLIDSAYFSRTSCTPQVLHSGQEEYSAVVAFAAGNRETGFWNSCMKPLFIWYQSS